MLFVFLQEKNGVESMALIASTKEISKWHQAYDDIDWEATIMKDHRLGKFIGDEGSWPVSIGSVMTRNKFDLCTINIICSYDKKNVTPS